MPYVDGFVLPVSKQNLRAYARMAKGSGELFRKHGALQFHECAGDDLNINWCVPFTRQIKTKPGETIMFSYIVYKSRAHRDRVNAKVMKDRAQRADGPEKSSLRPEANAVRRLQGPRGPLSLRARLIFLWRSRRPCPP